MALSTQIEALEKGDNAADVRDALSPWVGEHAANQFIKLWQLTANIPDLPSAHPADASDDSDTDDDDDDDLPSPDDLQDENPYSAP